MSTPQSHSGGPGWTPSLRSEAELLEADAEMRERLWWFWYQLTRRDRRRNVPRESRPKESSRARRCRQRFGVQPMVEFELGSLAGRARTVRWVLGVPWDAPVAARPPVRTLGEVTAAHQKAADVLWLAHFRLVLDSGLDRDWSPALKTRAAGIAADIRARYGRDMYVPAGPADERAWGAAFGELEALRWALGASWNSVVDAAADYDKGVPVLLWD